VLATAVAAGALAGCGGSDTTALQAQITELQAQVDDLQVTIDQLEQDTTVIRELEERVDGISSFVEDARSKLDEITSIVGGLGGLIP
jgi:prefoldin subunit 5